MSKAFTREDDVTEVPQRPTREPSLPPGARNYLTPEGALALEDELRRLREVARPAALMALSSAAEGGAPEARRALHELDLQLQELLELQAITEVVDPASQPPDRVRFGATVTVQGDDGRPQRWKLVGVREADPSRGKVSWLSPLAKALLDARVGDVVTRRSPRGDEELEVLAIAYDRP